jgi:hypothetical protein
MVEVRQLGNASGFLEESTHPDSINVIYIETLSMSGNRWGYIQLHAIGKISERGRAISCPAFPASYFSEELKRLSGPFIGI